jgi:hypothetical protein
MNDFAAFRVLWDSVPFTPQAALLRRNSLDWWLRRNNMSVGAAERALALYKLKTETQKT